MILVPIESAYATSYLVGHCDYGPILYRFWDTATYWVKIAYFSYAPLSFSDPAPYVLFRISR